MSEILRTVRSIQQDLRRSSRTERAASAISRLVLAESVTQKLKSDILSALAARGIIDPVIEVDSTGAWAFRYMGKEVGFSPGVIERGVAAGTLTAERIAEFVARDFIGISDQRG